MMAFKHKNRTTHSMYLSLPPVRDFLSCSGKFISKIREHFGTKKCCRNEKKSKIRQTFGNNMQDRDTLLSKTGHMTTKQDQLNTLPDKYIA